MNRNVTELTRAQCELVIARYNERTDWVAPYAHLATIYNKGKTPVSEVDAIALPNVGREAHTYLTHIITRWDSLADRTVFLQGSKPQPGYTGHLMPNVGLEDYVFSQDDLCLYVTYCSDTKVHWRSHRSSYEGWDDPLLAPHLPKSPGMFPDNSDYDFWLRPFYEENVVRMMRRDFDRNCPSSAMMSRQAFWKTLISQSVPFPRYVFTAQGAQFSVSRERLRARPRSYYERLLREMDYAVNPYQGHHFEYFWLYLLQPDDEHLRSLAQREPELRRGGALWTSRVTAWPLMAAQGSYRQSRHYFTEYSRIVQSPMHPLRRSAVTRRLRSHACKSILFVDHENTCLSPYVDARFRARVGSAGHVRSASAGLASDGLQIPQIALEVGRERKLDLIGHRSRRLNADILASVDLVLAMSPWAAGEVRRRWPEWRGPIELFAALDPQLSPASMRIPDTGTQWWRINDETLRKFRLAFEQADRCVDVLAGLVSDQTDQSASRTEPVRQERALR